MTQPQYGPIAEKSGTGIFVGLGGLVTSLLTAALLGWVEHQFGFALYSWTFWFVIPAGAMASGMLGASGYYAVARLLGHRPGSGLLVGILLSSVATFFTIQLLAYLTLEVEGMIVRDYIPFHQYLDISIRSMSMQFRGSASTIGSTGELGIWGYAVTVIQILGFALGGFIVYGYLKSLPYCQRCARYFSNKGTQTRYTADAQGLQSSAAGIINDFQAGNVATALTSHKGFGEARYKGKMKLRSSIEVRFCKQCGQHWAKYGVAKRSGSNWSDVSELQATALTDQAVDV